METGPKFAISKTATMVMEDIVVQMGQASLELQIARNNGYRYNVLRSDLL